MCVVLLLLICSTPWACFTSVLPTQFYSFRENHVVLSQDDGDGDHDVPYKIQSKNGANKKVKQSKRKIVFTIVSHKKVHRSLNEKTFFYSGFFLL